jgi:transcriptional regulator with XRE-family HTH domain
MSEAMRARGQSAGTLYVQILAWRERCPLTRWRSSRRFSRPDIAAMVGVSEQTIRNWEMGLGLPTAEHLAALAAVVEADDFPEAWAVWVRERPQSQMTVDSSHSKESDR